MSCPDVGSAHSVAYKALEFVCKPELCAANATIKGGESSSKGIISCCWLEIVLSLCAASAIPGIDGGKKDGAKRSYIH